MASITISVGPNSDGYSFPGAVWCVTGHAPFSWHAGPVRMSRVVKFHVEAFHKSYRKGLYWRRDRLCFLMANRADRAFAACKLIEVASYTCFMTGIFYFHTFLAAMARVAAELLMLRNTMGELFKCCA